MTPPIPSSPPRALGLLVGLILLAAPAWASLPDATAVARYADELLAAERIDPQGPGLALLVARGDALLLKTARGMASVELGVPLQAEHAQRLASITKQFSAALLLRLVDEGKAQLDDPLAKYLPDFPNGSRITLAQLLNHSSGVKSYSSLPDYRRVGVRRDLSTQELIASFRDAPPDFAPGTAWAYNNSGYALVGAVIERITGQPWHEALRQQLLEPAGLGIQYPAPDRLIPSLAAGYTRGAQGWAPALPMSVSQAHAGGALVGSVEALWRWNQLLHEKGLLKPTSYQHMVTPVGAAKAEGYGAGLFAGSLRGMPTLEHGGGILGFTTHMHYLPQQRITVAVLRNSDGSGAGIDRLARQLAAFAAGKPYPALRPVPLTPEQLRAYEGIYRQGNESRALRVLGGRLAIQRPGSPPLPLTPLGNDRFAVGQSLAQIQFDRDAEGRISAHRQYSDADELGGAAQQWARSGDLPQRPEIALSEAQRQALLGDYAGERLRLKVFVDAQGQLRAQVPGQPPVTLKASSPRELHIVEIDATLRFAPGDGPAAAVELEQGAGRVAMKRQS